MLLHVQLVLILITCGIACSRYHRYLLCKSHTGTNRGFDDNTPPALHCIFESIFSQRRGGGTQRTRVAFERSRPDTSIAAIPRRLHSLYFTKNLKKHHLRDRGFGPNIYLRAVSDTSIARTTVRTYGFIVGYGLTNLKLHNSRSGCQYLRNKNKFRGCAWLVTSGQYFRCVFHTWYLALQFFKIYYEY